MWEWQDAWILQAVDYSGRPGSLRSVIANADAINVDIPDRDALERAVRRLQGAGLVEAEQAQLHTTRQGKRVVKNSARWRDGIRSVTPRIEATLREEIPLPDRVGDWSLSESDWQRAYDEYSGAACK